MTAGIYIKTPFAATGDQTAFPEAPPVGGEVNWQTGFPIKYSEDPNTTGLRIDRSNTNYLFYVLSLNVLQYQSESYPRFITAVENGGLPFTYSQCATVYYEDEGGLHVYWSLVDTNNTNPSDDTKWRRLDPYNQAIERESPEFTGIPTVPTAANGTNTTQAASCAFVLANTGSAPDATDTTAGIVRLATQPETDAGVEAFAVITPATLREYLNSVVVTLAPITYDGLYKYSVAHGLGEYPKSVSVMAKLKAGQTDLDFPSGRSVQLATQANTASGDQGITISSDDTYIYLSIASNDGIGIMDNATDPHSGNMSKLSKWEFIITASVLP